MKGTELTDHIRDEMAKAANDYISMLGEWMTAFLKLHPDAEIDGKKTLAGAFAALRSAASKKQKGGCYAMPPREAFEGMLAYYGLAHAPSDFQACVLALIGQTMPDAASPEPAPEIRKPNVTADLFDLDALLGG